MKRTQLVPLFIPQTHLEHKVDFAEISLLVYQGILQYTDALALLQRRTLTVLHD